MNSEAAKPSDLPERPRSDADARRLHPIDWAVAVGAVDDVWQETQGKIRRRRRRFQVVAGSMAAALAIAGFLWNISGVSRKPGEIANGSDQVAVSGAAVLVPERRVLLDGSTIELKPGAEVRVDYTTKFRRVALVRGEAHFQVAKDAGRPFVVQAGGVEVRAVGTAFSVQLEARQVDVLVTEGRVAVERTMIAAAADARAPSLVEATAPTLAVVAAGRSVVIERDLQIQTNPPAIAELTAAEIDTRLAWRIPRLDFTRTPLSDAVPLINRHSRVKVVLGDSAVGEVRLSGILQADNLETLLRLLEAEHGVRAEWRGASEVVLRRTQ